MQKSVFAMLFEQPLELSYHLVEVVMQTGRAKDKMRVRMFLDAGVCC